MKSILLALFAASAVFAQTDLKPLRAGIVGRDTSHVPAFTKLFNKGETTGELAGIKVTTGYTGGTDMPASKDRKESSCSSFVTWAWRSSIASQSRSKKVDVVLLESVDGRIHLQEAREIFKAGKPVFIDKPVAGTLAEAIAIFELAKKSNVRSGRARPRVFRSRFDRHEGESRDRRHPQRDDLGPMLVSGRHAGPLLLRHPRHRVALRAHGHRLRKPFHAPKAPSPIKSLACGGRSEPAPIAAS